MAQVLRAVTLNLWGEQPPLSERMALCERELAALTPDLVALQEVRQIPAPAGHQQGPGPAQQQGQGAGQQPLPNQAQTLALALGMHHVFAGTVEWGGGLEGLAILSRSPIAHSGHQELPHATATERRIVLWAVIETEAGTVAAFTTHLNYRMAHGVIREDQVAAVDALVGQVMKDRQAHLGILMGDFNAAPDSDEVRFLRGLHSIQGRRTYYQDAYLRKNGGAPGATWSQRNPFTQRLRWLEPDRRIDYIFVSPMSRDGRGLVHECRIVLDTPDAAGVYPSDHFGVLAEVQLAPTP